MILPLDGRLVQKPLGPVFEAPELGRSNWVSFEALQCLLRRVSWSFKDSW